MKKIKSYTGIWNVEKVLYAINDFNLPFPVTFTQITWFVITDINVKTILNNCANIFMYNCSIIFIRYFG